MMYNRLRLHIDVIGIISKQTSSFYHWTSHASGQTSHEDMAVDDLMQ